jgi:hypothetical protein
MENTTVEQTEILTEMPIKKRVAGTKKRTLGSKKRTMGTSKPRVARLNEPPRLKRKK